MKFSIDEKSLRDLFSGFDKMLSKSGADVKRAIAATGIGIESKAKTFVTQKCKGDLGILRSSIMANYNQSGFGVRVGTSKDYAPYVEFGTGKMVVVPAGLESYAMQFKGQGIKEVNLPARPFLFPAYEIEAPKFIERLNKIYSNL